MAGLRLLLLLLPCCCATAWAERGLFFQPNNELTEHSHAMMGLASDRESLTNLSVCATVKILYFRPSGSYVFSYATSDRDNNELNLGIRPSQVFAAVGGSYVYGVRAMYFPDEWYNICLVANTTATSIYVNGEMVATRRMKAREVLLNGTLVLGQESDMVGGAFQPLQSFSGIITSFDLYSRSLDEEEVLDLATCEGEVEEGDVVGWSSTEWDIEGPVSKVNLTKQDYCNKQSFKFTVFPVRQTKQQTLDHCAKLKSRIALPITDRQNQQLFQEAERFANVCQPPNHARGFFWLGARWGKEEEAWVDEESALLNYTNFDTWNYNKRGCATYMLPRYRGDWTDVGCGIYAFCAACQEPEPVLVRLRGLCMGDDMDTMFRIATDADTFSPAFKGFTKYQIRYMDDRHWHLYDMWSSQTLARLNTQDTTPPLGLHQWRVASGVTMCGKTAGSLHKLSLSACHAGEYTCGDGTCISLDKRCDLRVDCPSKSDEVGCEKLVLPEDYLVHLPPPGPTTAPLGLNLTVTIRGFSKVDIQNMLVTTDFSTTITWIDQRLTYRNLKSLPEFNYINADKVWVPSTDLDNAIFPDIHTSDKILAAIRTSQPEPDDLSAPVHDEVFEGEKTPLRLSRKVQAPFTCNMDLRMFPFDTQTCLMIVRIDSAREHFLTWDKLEVAYVGEETTSEYMVGRITIEHTSNHNYSVALVSISFFRQYSYYLTSAFLPAIMLMLIGYASLFCKRENRDLRVMMALTTLLVLYSLYQQVDDSLPSTSYTKAIDVWFFFALTFIFTQVILHVAIDVKVTLPRKFPKPTVVLSISDAKGTPGDPTRSCCWNPLVASRVVYAVLLGVFLLVFWTVVLKHCGDAATLVQ